MTLSGDRAYFFFTLAVLGGLILFLARLRRSRFGRGLLLVGTDRQAAAAVGVSPWKAKVFAFVLAGFCAGLAGALTAPLYSTPPHYIAYTTFQSLFYLSVPVLAGFASLAGVAGVALGFMLVPQALEHHHISPFALGSAGLIIGPAPTASMTCEAGSTWPPAPGPGAGRRSRSRRWPSSRPGSRQGPRRATCSWPAISRWPSAVCGRSTR